MDPRRASFESFVAIALVAASAQACGGGSHDGAASGTGGAKGGTSSSTGARASSATGGSGTGTGGSACNPQPPTGPAFYVSPSGDDANDGASPSTPFQTLEKARSAMQAIGLAPYTTYVMDGTYARTQRLDLTSYYDQNKSWIAYPCATPVLDGGGAATQGIYLSGTGITIRGLTIQNFQSGIYAFYGDHITIDQNRLLDISTPDWRTNVLGGSIFVLRVNTSSVTNNYIDGNTEIGIDINAGDGDDNSNVTVSGNSVYNTCKVVNDCGAIHFRDVGHVSKGQVLTDNIIGDYGDPKNQTRGIYLDDETSNLTVTNNVVYGSGTWPIMIHGGDHDTIRNNVFDFTQASNLAFYQDDTSSGGMNYGMAGNVFEGNLVFSTAAPAGALWDFLDATNGGIALPAVSGNFYYDTAGTLANTGVIEDSSPTTVDPQFSDPASPVEKFYALSSSSPLFSSGFSAIDTSHWVAKP